MLYNKRQDKKYENYTDLYLQAQDLHKKEVKNGKKVKKAANSPAPPSVQAKKRIYSSNNKKLKLIKFYFNVSVIKNLFQTENKK